MNDNTTVQVGEEPMVNFDNGSSLKKMTRRIRHRVLSGDYSPDSKVEVLMIRDYNASGLSVDAYLAQVYPE